MKHGQIISIKSLNEKRIKFTNKICVNYENSLQKWEEIKKEFIDGEYKRMVVIY